MKSFLNQTASTLAGVAVAGIGLVMAGLGFSILIVLAVFALALMGLAILASPFVGLIARADVSEQPHKAPAA